MFDAICALPLSSDVFAQVVHPTEPLLAVGLAGGHVQSFRLPADSAEASDDGKSASESGCGRIETLWRTRRHNGSCRSLGYSLDGQALYSAGTDGLVKAAATETGRVFSKIAIPLDPYVDTPWRSFYGVALQGVF